MFAHIDTSDLSIIQINTIRRHGGSVQVGIDGKRFAVFEDEYAATDAAESFCGVRYACFDGYYNAIRLD